MTENIKESAVCNKCGLSLPLTHKGPCPKCGSVKKTLSVFASETIKISDSLSLEKRREFFKKKPFIGFIIWCATFISPIIGLFISGLNGVMIGLIIGILINVASPYAIMKIVEVERYESK